MTRQEIIDLLEIVAAAYPNAKIKDPERMVQAWQLAFAEDKAERVYKAARYHMNRNKFFPTVADIREGMEKASLIYDQKASDVPRIAAPAVEEDEWLCDQYCDDCGERETCLFWPFAHGGSKNEIQDTRGIHDGDNQGHPYYKLDAEHKAQE